MNSKIQARRNGGRRIWERNKIPNEREWFSILTCINAAGKGF
jgi:hypothetical protein